MAPNLRSFMEEMKYAWEGSPGFDEAERQMRALLAVARAGCARHPTYKAIRKPTAVCPQCNALWRLSRVSRSAE